MGGEGDTTFSHDPLTEEGSSIDQEFPEQTSDKHKFSEESSRAKVENGSSKGDFDLNFESLDSGFGNACYPSSFLAEQRWALNVCADLLASYDELPCDSAGLEEAKSRILSYRPGSWIEEVGGLALSDYHLPDTTTILLIGPKGSGKSSLVNKISKVFEDDKFASERAQVSCHTSAGEGTYFLHEYMIPRGSNAFCLYDTRGMSDDPSGNMRLLKHWMTKGVCHGELVKRASDDGILESRMKCKARQIGDQNAKVRMVNFVIMVVNAISVLESMERGHAETKRYTKIIAEAFNNPFLSFKDDKPVVVVTHGDLLPISDRVRVRLHLGTLLGIPPRTQIFDIPESNDLKTELAIVGLLRHCLEHADSNLPIKSGFILETDPIRLSAYWLPLLLVAISVAFAFYQRAHKGSASSDIHIDWHTIRHLWY